MPINPFVSLFGRSPIGPMQQHIAKAHECAANLVPFFEAVMVEDWAKVEQVQQEMSRLEHEADKLKKSVRLHLPKSLFLPVPRSDLLELLSVQDKVANRAKDIAGLMLGRQMAIPQPLQPLVRTYVQRSVDASAQALKAMNELDELLETGFAGREAVLVENLIEELGSIENDTDRLQIEVRRNLFKLEKDLPPVDVMFLYQIIDWIGDVADPVDDLIEEHHIDRGKVLLQLEQVAAHLDLQAIGIVFDRTELLDQVFHQHRFATGETGLEQFVQFVHRLKRLGAGVYAALYVGTHQRLQRLRNGHLPTEHEAGDVLGTVGDFVLYTEQLEQVRTRHRQEQTLGQVQAHAFLQLVGLVLQAGHLLLYLFYLGPVFDHYGLEERHQVRRALMGLGDMLLHGADG